VEWLAESGFEHSQISLVVAEKTRGLVPKTRPMVPESAATGGALGALIGGLVAIGALAVPGLGILAVGPLVAAIAGGAFGAATGGLAGALVGFGIPDTEARRYAEEVMNDGFVIAVHPPDQRKAEVARNVISRTRAVKLEYEEDSVAAKLSKPLREALQ
jgi:hypothetical protein